MRKNLRKVFWLIAMLVLTSSAFAQRIAVLNFNAGTGITQGEVDGISSIFNTYFAPKGAQIIERTRIDRLLQEQKFQRTKYTESDMVELGRMLNVSIIVVGDVNIVMGQYNLDVRAVNTQNAQIIAKDGASWAEGNSFRDMMRGVGERLASQIETEQLLYQIAEKKEIKELPPEQTTSISNDVSKLDRKEVIVLHGYLKVYPEEFGPFKTEPFDLIRRINKEKKYGYDGWKLPTNKELDMLRSEGYLSGEKYMTRRSPTGKLLLVTKRNKKYQYK